MDPYFDAWIRNGGKIDIFTIRGVMKAVNKIKYEGTCKCGVEYTIAIPMPEPTAVLAIPCFACRGYVSLKPVK